MLNLRARQYEPAMNRFSQNRFSQKDIVRGQVTSPLSLNRYAYGANSPIMHIDPSGESVVDSIGNWWNKAKQTTIGKVVDTMIVKPATSAVKKIAKVVKPIVAPVIEKAVSKVRQTCEAVQKELATIDPSRPTCAIEKQLVWNRACSKAVGDEKTANDITKQLERIQSYDKNDWLFMTGDCLLDDSFTLSERFAILDVLKKKQDITAEDLIQIGIFTEETRYHPFFFGLFKEDVAGNAAALLELSYRLTRYGTTIQEMSIQEQQMRVQQQYMMLYYLGMQAGLSSVQAYNAAGSAIRMNGATVAAPGYESVASDYLPFNYAGTQYDIAGTVTTVRVGRWMSVSEYQMMLNTGKVQMSPNGNTTYVARPSDMTSFEKQAKPGSVYVEFDVDVNSVYPAGNPSWGQIPGPGSLYDRYNIRRGLEPITSMPNALNITLIKEK